MVAAETCAIAVIGCLVSGTGGAVFRHIDVFAVGDYGCGAVGVDMLRGPEFLKYITLHIHGLTLLDMIEQEVVVFDLERIDSGSLLGYERIVLGIVRGGKSALCLHGHGGHHHESGREQYL